MKLFLNRVLSHFHLSFKATLVLEIFIFLSRSSELIHLCNQCDSVIMSKNSVVNARQRMLLYPQALLQCPVQVELLGLLITFVVFLLLHLCVCYSSVYFMHILFNRIIYLLIYFIVCTCCLSVGSDSDTVGIY